MSTSPTITLKGHKLFCERDDRILFSGLNFTFHDGQIIRIAGPNGAGKSTLLRILVGLSAGYEGQLWWNGQQMDHSLYEFRNELLYLGHHVGVKGQLSAEENLAWACPGFSQQAIYQALAQVGLQGYEDLPCHNLSAGQQRRVALARLYLDNKRVWILDEPFTAIDKEGVLALEQHLANHAQQGGMVILTTHHDLSVPVQTLQLGQGNEWLESEYE